MRKLMTISTLLLLLLVLVSCGGLPDFDPHEAASIFATAEFFCDPMHAIDDHLARNLYGLENESVSLAAYAGNGVTPEAVLVIKCTSEEDAQRIATQIDDYNERQIKIFEIFNTAYLYEAEEAILAVHGNYVFYIACCDANAAQQLLESYIDSLNS